MRIHQEAFVEGDLNGSGPVYYIYVDEAGTSAREPVTVVVGVVIHADRHWRRAEERLDQLCDEHVPKELREGFHFHATRIFSGYRDFDESWPRESRVEFIGAVAQIPRYLNAAISLGKIRRDSPGEGIGKLTKAQVDHLVAFQCTLGRADKYIRDWGEPKEVATVVAEDVPEIRRFLRQVNKVPFPSISSEMRRPTKRDLAAGRDLQTDVGPVERIVDTPHFTAKDGAPLLQIADACAFSFRRYFAEKNHGVDLVRAILGFNLDWEGWQGPGSNVVFSFDPERQYQ